MRINWNFLLKSVSYLILFELTRFLKVNFIVGSTYAFFSGGNCVGPLSGAWYGFVGTSLFALWTIVRSIVWGELPFTLTAYHISTVCASAYWTTRSWLVRIGIPVACIFLFIAHPVGRQAFFYSFYWFIPLALYFVKKQTLFTTALGSTFTAHAVGSVLWLYTGSYTPAMFVALMPVVIIERLFFACGMVLVHQAIEFIVRHSQLFSVKSGRQTIVATH
jgi:hypothetical protein